jgi:two-component system OmpR family sensor kinase
MNGSIRNQLLKGLAAVAALSTVALTILVSLEYGLFRWGLPPPPLGPTMREMTDHVILPVLIFVTLSGIGSVIVVRSVARRLSAAAEAAQAAAAKGEAPDMPIEELPREVQPYASAVKELMARLEAHARRQEAFAADAAHELRTPLAIMALELDQLPAEDAARLRVQVRALTDLVNQLLLLARANAPDTAEHRAAPVDLSAACRRLVAEMAPAAIREGRTLAYEDCGPAPMKGLEEAVVSAVRTLTVNALRVTPEGGEVVIAAGPGAQICVRDGGPGLDAETLSRLKARGVRADMAAVDGAGLGLAIADRIAEAHGGDLETCMPEHAGIRLRFPPVAH